MKFIDEYRGQGPAAQMARAIHRSVTRPWTIMEVCGGQTHTIVKSGLQELLPPEITLVHGPGCPVCVTPLELIDSAVAIAGAPGSHLLFVRRHAARAGLVAEPVRRQSRRRRRAHRVLAAGRAQAGSRKPRPPGRLLRRGLRDDGPGERAWPSGRPSAEGIDNFSILVAHVLVPPAMEAILSSPNCRVQAFLAAGHVCTVMGYEQYEPIARRYRVPIVVTGFEPLDLLEGIHMAVVQLESGRAEVENQYSRAVRREGNRPAQQRIAEVFEVGPRAWRGIGDIPSSGLRLREPYRRFDALSRFPVRAGPRRGESRVHRRPGLAGSEEAA